MLAVLFLLKMADIVFQFPLGSVSDLEVSSEFLYRQQLFFHVAMLMTLYAIAFRRLTGLGFLAVAALAFLANETRLVYEVFHHWMNRADLYPSAWRKGGAVNAQYATLVIFVPSFLLLTGLMLWRRFRSVHRGFIWMSVCAVLATSFVFHLVIPMSALAKYKQDMKEVVELAASASDPTRREMCRIIGFECIEVADGASLRAALSALHVDEQQVRWIEGESQRVGRGRVATGVTSFVGGAIGFAVEQYAYRPPFGGRAGVVVIDHTETNKGQILSEIQFGMLAVVAHGFWILFGAFLCVAHDHRWWRRSASGQG